MRIRSPFWLILHEIRLPVVIHTTLTYPEAMEILTADEIVRLTPPERLALIAQL